MQRTPRPFGTRLEKKPPTKIAKLVTAATISAGLLLAAGLGYLQVDANTEIADNMEAATAYTPPEITAPPIPDPHPVETTSTRASDAINRLKNRDQTWTMTVLSDSTSNEPTEWVQLLVKRLAEATGRPATIHNWENSKNGTKYGTETVIPGEGAPIIVWNGSAPGNKALDSLNAIDVMAPERADLLVISHAHNQVNGDETLTQISSLIRWAQDAWEEQPGLALVIQNPSLGLNLGRQASNTDAIRRQWDEAENLILIDAYMAFDQSDDIPSLLREDRFHPSEKGSRLWADTAWNALDLDQFEN
ncbi:SGNH/GDSL hydrolase family protein [Kocuria sabuli]|uniref:SGNH/GDSL hydrolase family protein n=1 Tax=Kocuria sabuli TaxID=3071448 RepID=UPI0034D6AADF